MDCREPIAIGSVATIKLTKAELVDILNNNFNDKDYVGVLTEIGRRDDNDVAIITQSLTLSKIMKW